MMVWGSMMRSGSAPAGVDVVRDGDVVKVLCDAPGVREESVQVDVDGRVLTVSFEREAIGEGQVLVAGRPSGRFERRLRLDGGVDVDKVSASLVRGVLTVELPVSQPSRRVEVVGG